MKLKTITDWFKMNKLGAILGPIILFICGMGFLGDFIGGIIILFDLPIRPLAYIFNISEFGGFILLPVYVVLYAVEGAFIQSAIRRISKGRW